MTSVIVLDNICWITNATLRIVRFDRFPSVDMVVFGGMTVTL